jgi:hypothetical protein
MRHPIQLPNYMGCLMEFYTSLTLFYAKMKFKILKFSNRPSVFSPEQSTLLPVPTCSIFVFVHHIAIARIRAFDNIDDGPTHN